jgi:hypothetical protein
MNTKCNAPGRFLPSPRHADDLPYLPPLELVLRHGRMVCPEVLGQGGLDDHGRVAASAGTVLLPACACNRYELLAGRD